MQQDYIACFFYELKVPLNATSYVHRLETAFVSVFGCKDRNGAMALAQLQFTNTVIVPKVILGVRAKLLHCDCVPLSAVQARRAL